MIVCLLYKCVGTIIFKAVRKSINNSLVAAAAEKPIRGKQGIIFMKQ